MVFNMPNMKHFQHTLKFWHGFQHALQFLTHAEIFNMLCQQFSTHIIVFSMPWNFQHVFNIPWNIQHSFEHALQFSTCAEILNTQHALQFSDHSEIFNMLFYSFQNILKFQHDFLQFSEHAENFNMLFYSFQHSFSIGFLEHALQISTCSEIFNTCYIFCPANLKIKTTNKCPILLKLYTSDHQPMDTTKSCSYWTQIITTYLMIYKPLKSVDLPLFPLRLDSWSTYARLKEPVHLRNKIK